MPPRQKTFHVLLALHAGPLHGYAIRKTVLEVSEGALELEPGGLYRLLAKLAHEGLVEPCDPPPHEESTDERRQYYSLTAVGKETLSAEAHRLSALLARPEVAPLMRRGPS